MELVRLERPDDVDGWRRAARGLIARRVPPDGVVWQVGDGPGDLFAQGQASDAPSPALRVPRDFLALAGSALLNADPERFALLYALLWRVVAQPGLIRDRADRPMRRAHMLAKGVGRDIHKMRAFVRFRALDDRFVAWFEPEHHILRANARFFVDRFANRCWSILTPGGALHWDGAMLSEGPPAQRGDAPGEDPVEAIWHTYYAAIFNPARLMTGAMMKEMPRKYWKNMPETALIPGMIAGARERERAMIDRAPRS